MYTSINGDILRAEDAKILISDLSIQRGYGIFDFFRTENGQPLFLSDHLDRFYNSASRMYLDPGIDRAQLTRLLLQLMLKNELPESGIRITLTGGYSDDGYTLPGKPNLIITQSILHIDKEAFHKGISVVTSDHQRQLPGIKTIDYLKAIYLQPYIKAHGAEDVLYYHQNEVTECPRANFFIVNQDGELLTPAQNILEGITRKRILALRELNCRQGLITLQDLAQAREAFVSSTTRIALPVVKINGILLNNGKPGPVTTSIFEALAGVN